MPSSTLSGELVVVVVMVLTVMVVRYRRRLQYGER